jgi:deferrochelatase/peroxidase EfeB
MSDKNKVATTPTPTVYEVLTIVQNELKAPKSQYNSFGKYKYRNCEDILEALKPILAKHNATVYLDDELVNVGDRYYVKANAFFRFQDGVVNVSAYAREEESKKGMDGSQVSGASSSYARKYSLNALFLIDDTADSDATNSHGREAAQPQAKASPKVDTSLVDSAILKAKTFTTSDELVDWCGKLDAEVRTNATFRSSVSDIIATLK